jgi:hypothetical protein
MDYQQFRYPSYEDPLATAYGGIFECAFVLLHPFTDVTEDDCPPQGQHSNINPPMSSGVYQTWASVNTGIGFQDYAKLNQALLTLIRAIRAEFCDFAACEKLESFLKLNAIWEPRKGSFDFLVLRPLLSAFECEGIKELIYIPEIQDDNHPIQSLSIATLLQGEEPPFFTGSLVAPDASFLLAVDWDSFFTLFFGSQKFVTDLVTQRSLEGFLINPTTSHFWFHEAL